MSAPAPADSPGADSREARAWLWGTLAAGGALRLLAVLFSAPTPGDDAGRLMVAGRWALHPHWYGLSGVWSPLHTYMLGGLIAAGGHPLLWVRLLGWVTTTAALPLFFLCVRDLYGDVRRAGLSALLLAVYYVHVWLAGTAYTEGPYTAFLLLGLWGVIRATRAGAAHRHRDALIAGLAVTVAILLRHEAKVVWLVVVPWLALRADRGTLLRFAVPSGIAFVWQLIEPSLRGTSFAEDVELVTRWKLAEVTMHGSKLLALKRWILMPGGSPSAVVVVLGLAGLWSARRALARDLFALLFLVQVGVFLALTIYPGWQPYLRYMFLYFMCLLPHAALALQRLAARRSWVTVAVLALILVNQAVAWSGGRNHGRPLGWLPVYRPAPEQATLDRWVREHTGMDSVFVLPGYPQAWDVTISLIAADRCDLLQRYRELSYDQIAEIDRGPGLDLSRYDSVILDPAATRFRQAWATVPPGAPLDVDTPRLRIVRARVAP